MKKQAVRSKHKGRVLSILDNGKPLTQIEIARLIANLEWKDVELLSRNMPTEIKGWCEVLGKYVGQGVCIAKKYFKYGLTINECKSCKSQEIVDQLNYIFNKVYDGRYYAQWRSRRKYRKN
jgi:hypothetical protein